MPQSSILLMRFRLLLFSGIVAFALHPPAVGQIVVDGTLSGDESEYGAALSMQNTNTQYGNATNGDPRYANGGSEIDQVFATVSDARLYVLVSGNLESNFNKLDVFIDSVPGGVNQLIGASLPVRVDPFCCGGPPTPTGALQQMNGLRFDAGFEADRYITFSNGTESFSSPTMSTYSLSSYYADLTGGSQGSKSEVGFERNAFGVEPGLAQGEPIDQLNNGCPGPAGPCSPPVHEFAEPVDTVNDPTNIRNHRGFLNDIGLRMAINNSNTVGVTSGSGETAGNPQSVVTGIEFSLPLSTLGNPVGEIKIMTFINNGPHNFVSNQFSGTGILRGNLGSSLSTINLATIAGNQYVSVFSSNPGDFNHDGVVDAADYTVWRDTLGQSGTGLAADGTGPTGVPDGVVDQLDYDFWKANFGNHAGSGSGANAAVPEPTTLWILLVGILTMCCRRRPMMP